MKEKAYYRNTVKNLLAIGTDSKTVKGEKLGWKTAILYLVPAGQLNLPNFCPHASEGCKQACLFTAGRGKFSNVIFSRQRKSEFFVVDREGFLEKLHGEIAKLSKKHDKLAIRLNGTSDIPWENLVAMERFPKAKFYDYTKNFKRMERYLSGMLPSNYHLTFSKSETNESQCRKVLKLGGNVAMVFRNGLPASYGSNQYQVIDGDSDDLRFLDPSFSVVGLKAKGGAKHDKSGFVVG